MNILQISFRDLIGQRFNGYELHHSLRKLGHDSEMLVLYKQSEDPTVHGHPRWAGLLERGLYLTERVTGLQGLLSPIGLSIPHRECFRRAELVHWHLIYPHYIGLPSIPRLTRLRPTVWTLHDPWATTGHCVHPIDCERWKTGCGHCPDLKRNFTIWFDTTDLIWKAKAAAYRRSNLTLVVGSRWMRDRVAASPLLSSFPCHVIPFGLDLGVWHPRKREAARARLGIPGEARVVAFRMPRGAKQKVGKGIPWLLEALGALSTARPITLMVFEEPGQLATLAGRFPIVELGWVEDPNWLAEAMSAADLFVMPSLAESFGVMALEAMACGTPVIASANSSLPDTIHAPEAGLTVPARDAAALARTMERLLDDDALRSRLGEAGRRIVERDHSYDRYVERHEALYRDVLERSRVARSAC